MTDTCDHYSLFCVIKVYPSHNTGLGDKIAEACSNAVGAIGNTFADVRDKVETSIAKAKENSTKSEIHHIVAQKSSYYAAVESRALLARYDIDVNDAISLMPVKPGVNYFGVTRNGGIGFPGGEVHVEWGETATMNKTKFNVFDAANSLFIRIMEW